MLSRSSTILAGVGLNASGLNPALHIQYFNRSYDVNNPHIFKKLDDLDILDTSEDGDFGYDQHQAVSSAHLMPRAAALTCIKIQLVKLTYSRF